MRDAEMGFGIDRVDRAVHMRRRVKGDRDYKQGKHAGDAPADIRTGNGLFLRYLWSHKYSQYGAQCTPLRCVPSTAVYAHDFLLLHRQIKVRFAGF